MYIYLLAGLDWWNLEIELEKYGVDSDGIKKISPLLSQFLRADLKGFRWLPRRGFDRAQEDPGKRGFESLSKPLKTSQTQAKYGFPGIWENLS